MPEPLGGVTGQAAKVITAIKGGTPWWQQPIRAAPFLGGAGGLLWNPYAAAAMAGIGIGNIPAVKKTTQKWWGITDWDEFQEYQDRGGDLSYNQWRKQGKPKATVSAQPEWLTPRTREIVGKPEYAEAEAARGAGSPIPGRQAPEKPPTDEGEDAFAKQQALENERWEKEFAEKKRQFDEKQRIQTYTKFGVNPYDRPETPEEEGQWNPYTGQWEQPPGWISPEAQGRLDLQGKQMEQQRLQDEALMGWYREQAAMQQQEQERQYKSQLMANPMSWLQYSSYTGQAPVVQEWMKPLMSGQYQTGQQIPGWMGGQGEGQAMGSLPELRTPSAQLWGRMGPTAQAQYMGYGQARTGIRPEETMFRLGASAPPSGRFGGLRRMR